MLYLFGSTQNHFINFNGLIRLNNFSVNEYMIKQKLIYSKLIHRHIQMIDEKSIQY